MKSKQWDLPYEAVTLNDASMKKRRDANRRYLMSLDSDRLLLNFRHEAGLPLEIEEGEKIHGGWEFPTCQLRGHFLGHWLSAAAMEYASTGDKELKAKADHIVDELAVCQKENGGEWVGSIPEKYLYRIAEGKTVWAPHYTVHKTFMGLLDMYRYAGNQKALEIALRWAKWFSRWSGQFTREEFDDILDVETGGMLEIWSELYGITGEPEHKQLMERYYRGRLFDVLLAGGDPLTNMHANTTIPEVLGAAKAYEVTGDDKWMKIVRNYWDCAVTKRGQYATGGQTCGEIWTPMRELAARLGDKNQEHCTVYNMMRLADFLFRWTGDAVYADYWEQNLYNGIMAQGYWEGSFTHGQHSDHPTKGLLTYFLPLRGGAVKGWASETDDFFCCHGTLVQANATHDRGIYYADGNGISICQYVDSNAVFEVNGNAVLVHQSIDTLAGSLHRSSTSSALQRVNDITAIYKHNPRRVAMRLSVESEIPMEFEIRIRIPWWTKGNAVVLVNGETVVSDTKPSSFLVLKRVWNQDEVYVELPKGLTACPMPDAPDMVAFADGPVVLAGLCDSECILYGDKDDPESMLVPDNERQWGNWMNTYKTKNQERGIRFIPLYEVGYEPYSVYFQIKPER